MQVKRKVGMKNWCFSTNISFSFRKTVKDTTTVTIENEQKLVCDLSNGAISTDLL